MKYIESKLFPVVVSIALGAAAYVYVHHLLWHITTYLPGVTAH